LNITCEQSATQKIDSQVTKACKQVLRVIWSRGLDRGDVLPTQLELQKMYGFSHNVLSPAMQRLVRAGVVTRTPKLGTFVVDPRAFREPIWRIAVAENFISPSSASPFFSLLAGFVQRELIGLGCRPKLYLRPELESVPRDPVSIYGGLADDVQQGALDGAIALGCIDEKDWRRCAGVAPICGFAESASCGAAIDQRVMAKEAVTLLASAGCRRISIISNTRPPELQRFWDGFEEGVALACLPRWSGELISAKELTPRHLQHATWQIAAGQCVANFLAAMSPKNRPDSLIVLDDFTAAGLTATLREIEQYRPRIAVLTNLQVNQVYALPVFRFQLDIDLLARRGVAVLFERLLNLSLPPKMDWIAPRYNGEPESQFPPACVTATSALAPSGIAGEVPHS
jgi:DNA-binding transcriptional regulator YhcF (GntR family)